MLWQRGRAASRQQDYKKRFSSELSDWHRRLGIQDSSQAHCLSHISGDWVIDCRTMKRYCWLSFHFSTLRMSSSGAPRPWIASPWECRDLAGNVSLDTGPPVTDYFSSFQRRPLTVVILLYSYRSPASRGQNHWVFAQKKAQHLFLCLKSRHENTKICLSLFPQCS